AKIVPNLFDFWTAPGQVESGWWDSLPGWQQAVVRGAVDPYVDHLVDGYLGPITWERELFFINEEVQHQEQQHEQQPQLASRPVDITGRPRTVVHGPNITLPPGSWSAAVTLGFSEEAADLSYIAEVHSDTLLAPQVRIRPGGQRLVEANLNFSIAEPHMVAV